jgi:hypothetical protein
MPRVAAISVQNTLDKFGAHLRWLLEKSGIDPETVVISIGVQNVEDQSRMISTFLREFNPQTMVRCENGEHAGFIGVHGVPVWAILNRKTTAA